MEIPRAAVVLTLLSVPLGGCAVETQAPEAVGYVLLDREALASGRLTHGEWAGAPVLPVALDVTEPVAFSSSVGRTVFDLRPGMLAWIHGAGGAVEWRAVRDDLRDDRLRVHGSRDAAAALAQRLAGQLIGPVEEGVWSIAAPDVFARGSFLAAPDGVTEVSPEPKLDLGPARGRLVMPVDPSPGALVMPGLVGLYTAGERALVLDASGGFSLEEGCFLTSVDRGRWHAEADQVVLEGAGGRTALTFDPTDGTLRHPGGERFTSLVVDSILAAAPAEAP